MARKTITTDEETYTALKEAKEDGETWSQFLQRLLESPDSTVNENECITQGDLDDLRAELTRDIPTEVENRMTRR